MLFARKHMLLNVLANINIPCFHETQFNLNASFKLLHFNSLPDNLYMLLWYRCPNFLSIYCFSTCVNKTFGFSCLSHILTIIPFCSTQTSQLQGVLHLMLIFSKLNRCMAGNPGQRFIKKYVIYNKNKCVTHYRFCFSDLLINAFPSWQRQFLSLQSEINVPIQTSNKDIVPARLHVPKHIFHQQRFCFCDTVIFFLVVS